jgi:hypothetical protein
MNRQDAEYRKLLRDELSFRAMSCAALDSPLLASLCRLNICARQGSLLGKLLGLPSTQPDGYSTAVSFLGWHHQSRGEGKIRRVAKDGIPNWSPPMPPHPDLSEKDLNDLVEFLRSK